MTNLNGWTEYENARSISTSLEKYNNQLVVVIGRGKKPVIYLTERVLKELGNPARVRVFMRGSNMGLLASDNGKGFTVVKSDAKLKYLSTKSLAREKNLAPGAYTAHVESGVIVFDTQQEPSKT